MPLQDITNHDQSNRKRGLSEAGNTITNAIVIANVCATAATCLEYILLCTYVLRFTEKSSNKEISNAFISENILTINFILCFSKWQTNEETQKLFNKYI